MTSVDITYSPPGVSFMIKDSLTAEIEAYLHQFLQPGERVSIGLTVNKNGEVSHTSTSGNSRVKYIDLALEAERYLQRKYTAERYTSGSQRFLIATNMSTQKQNVVAMDKREAERVIAQSLTSPSIHMYAYRDIDFLVDSLTGEVIFEKLRDPESYARGNYRETSVVLPENASTVKQAKESAAELSSTSFISFFVIDGTHCDKISDVFVEKLAEELSMYVSENSKIRGIRLRGLSGKHSRLFAHYFRYKNEGFIVW